jgi:nucleotide-binding universal stress UspA family protein
MLAIRHILFPLDFSDRCCAAAPFVEAMASFFGAKITLVSAASPFRFTGMGDAGVVVDPDEIIAEIKAQLDGALVKELAHLRVERMAEYGDPAQVIVDFAHNNNVDLIMMPTHGYGPFRTLLLGSVTAKVLHDAQCPVWTAAHVEDAPSREHIKPRSILCALDATEKSVPIMQWASDLRKAMGAALRLVHVIPSMEAWPSAEMDRQYDFEETMRQEAQRQIARMQQDAGVEAPVCVAVGNFSDAVREEARRHGADLVVIGRGVLNEKLGRLRTHSYEIIRHAPCPVLSV